MNFDYLGEIAKQGLGWLLFAGSVVVIYFLYKEIKQLNKDKIDLANQRVADVEKAREAYGVLSQTASKTSENTLTIVQNIQSILNTWKKYDT